MWWQILIAVGVGMSGVLLATLLGGWLVFRARTITMPSQFFSPVRNREKSSGKPARYLPDSLSEFSDDGFEEELSPAAARLRGQKLDGSILGGLAKEPEEAISILKGITGGKK